MRRALAAAAALAAAVQAPLRAESGERRFDVAPGPLRVAVVALGEQAGVTIGFTDPALGDLPVRGVRGRMPVADALARLLAGTPATSIRLDPQSFRIVRRTAGNARRQSRPPPGDAGRPPPERPIIVTGSKLPVIPSDYPGAITRVDVADLPAPALVHGSEGLVAALPIMASTDLGPGRNKLFIRGIADSSFTGQSQATVGEYLGDVRLNYNAPDPDLALYDIASVEVVEGPQGTLYGAGSLGGVMQLVPNPPTLDDASLTVAGGVSATAHGAPGGDASGVVNVPLVSGRLALRAVGYGAVDGGYIDDPAIGRTDINRTITHGGRLTLRFQPSPGWTVDLGGVVQNINSDDGQYSIRGFPPLTRDSLLPQPFDNDYALASLTVRHAAGPLDLVSATSVVRHDVATTYDASTGPTNLLRYREEDHITLLTNETRLSRRSADGGGWIVGVEMLQSSDRLTRDLGPPGAAVPLSGTRNRVDQASVYGEATLRLASRWFVTAGARASYSRLTADALAVTGGDGDRHRHDLSLLPSVGLRWAGGGRLSAYLRYQEGERTGGLSVQEGSTRRYSGDSLSSWEAGVRLGRAADILSASIIGSYAHWENIQADLVTGDGLPYTDNIGSGRILGLEVSARWRPFPGLWLDATAFVDDSTLNRPAPGYAGERDASLPNIADATARLGLRYETRIAGHPLRWTGSLRYVGRSRLGVGTTLDLRQGGYFDTATGVRIVAGRVTWTLDASNLLDTRPNLFALGNPFGVAAGNQQTPPRPRTIRLGARLAF